MIKPQTNFSKPGNVNIRLFKVLSLLLHILNITTFKVIKEQGRKAQWLGKKGKRVLTILCRCQTET